MLVKQQFFSVFSNKGIVQLLIIDSVHIFFHLSDQNLVIEIHKIINRIPFVIVDVVHPDYGVAFLQVKFDELDDLSFQEKHHLSAGAYTVLNGSLEQQGK